MSNMADSGINADPNDKTNRNWLVFAKMHFDNAKDEDIIRYLWNCTPFPFANWELLERQIILDGAEFHHDILEAIEQNLIRINQMLNN